jgi:hypothetical protein
MITTNDKTFKIALTMTTNGRNMFLEQTITSLKTKIFPKYNFDTKIIIDDSGLVDNYITVKNLCPEFIIYSHKESMGLAQTVQDAWNSVPSNIDYIFHLEDDFIFNKTPELEKMISILEVVPYLSQMLLLRQPVNTEEAMFGGYIQQYSDEYHQSSLEDFYWIENNRFFSLNPSIIPRKIFGEYGWPSGNEAEMTATLNNDGFRHGIWGKKDDVPVVEHIGVFRPEWWKL